MIRKIIIAALALACAFTSAEARRVRPVNLQGGFGCSDPIMKPCYPVSRALERHQRTVRGARTRLQREVSAAMARHEREDGVARPARYIAGRLVCAVNVNAELARRGIRGTGSALAKSFLHWGRASRPVAGAVAVYGRRGGGHVAIVSRVVNGRVYVWNPSSRKHQWREVEYRKRAISYRVAAQ